MDTLRSGAPEGAPPVGARFTESSARKWTADDGRVGTHTVVTLCEITERDAIGFAYIVVDVLENSDPPPPPYQPFIPERGRMAWFGLAAALDRGRVIPWTDTKGDR